ncbi:MAG: sulfatase-like hydrolase/transferase [Rubripirellula sp.]
MPARRIRIASHIRTIVVAIAIAAVATSSLHAEEGRPNILWVTVDNLGYGDLSIYNPDSLIQAPRLAQLAREGATLTDFYTASPTCTVSRACLLTGRIAQRHGLVNQLPGLQGNYGVGLDPREVLISQVLKRSGYATGCFGKWNIGFAAGSRPTERGFDEFLGHASGNMDYYHHLYNGKHDLFRGTESHQADGEYSTDLFADAAIEFMKSKSESGTPWFCYLPFNAPHFPNAKNKRPGQPNQWQAPDSAFDAYPFTASETDPHSRYMAVVTAVDTAIGRVLDAVDELGPEKTFVFWFSDNGAFDLKRKGIDVGSNYPLRSGGVTCWEGGIRVPAIARWPGKIPAGTTVRAPLWSPDLMIASAKLAKAELPDVALDGRNPLPSLMNNAASPHNSLFFLYRNHAALRQGDWKIVRTKADARWQLFDLSQDVRESRDLRREHPQQLERLADSFERWNASIESETASPPRR